MQLQTFLEHHGLTENPFSAEEARDDPVFQRLLDLSTSHPDFEKVFGDPAQPRPAVVFGEKGSGKTALRLMIERRLQRYNAERSDQLAWVVRYDDLNPFIDELKKRYPRLNVDELLGVFRLNDHMDAMLSCATTRLVDNLIGVRSGDLRGKPARAARRMARQRRADLAVLAMLYDQPRSGSFIERFARLRRALRIGIVPWAAALNGLGLGALLVAAGLGTGLWLTGAEDLPSLLLVGVLAAAGLVMLAAGAVRQLELWKLARRVRREVRVIDRPARQMRQALGRLALRELNDRPIPLPGDEDSRYQLLGRLLDVLGEFGFASMIVLVDRVDEPILVSGEPERMRALIWPLLNNKFLQQDHVGIKLLLPIELRHLLLREGSAFFQQARLDKQQMVDRLEWSGTLLYDLCSRRLQACQPPNSQALSLAGLFADDVTAQDLIDALDQMHQPRDAFKFIYQVLLEHCAGIPEDQPVFRIPRLTLDYVRKAQSQRVQQLARGLGPA